MMEKSIFKSVAGAACVGLAIGSLAWSLTVWGQQGPVQSPQEPIIPLNYPQLGQAQIGVITRADDGKNVWIDGISYKLAYGMIIQDENGTPVQYQGIAGRNVHYSVQYWLGSDATKNQIVRMIVFFPR
jgi:hypothetical protein